MAKQSNIKIIIDPGRGAESTIKKFKRLVESAGILKEYKRRREYKKPSVRRKEKHESAIKRRHKELIKKKIHASSLKF